MDTMSSPPEYAVSDADLDAMRRIPEVEHVDRRKWSTMGLVVDLHPMRHRGGQLLPGCTIEIRTNGGKGQRLRIRYLRDAKGYRHMHPLQPWNSCLCLGNISRTISKLIKRREYAAVVNLLVQFLKEG